MYSLQNKIDNIDNIKNIVEFNELLINCVDKYEMTAVVFIYDIMKQKKIQLNDRTYEIINKLHSKKVKENNTIKLQNTSLGKKLQPRRRIHKIMKGYNYKNALKKKNIVIAYLNNNNYDYDGHDNNNKKKLNIDIKKSTQLTDTEINFILGYLNRIKFFETKNEVNILSYFT